MSKSKKIIWLGSTLILTLASCSRGKGTASTSEVSSAASSEISSSASTSSLSSDGDASSSAGQVAVTSLAEAIANTASYAINIDVGEEWTYTYQVVSPSFYYYSPMTGGYAELDNDKGYLHYFDTETKEENVYDFDIFMHGRTGTTSSASDLYYLPFLDILSYYADDFVQVDEHTFSSSLTELADEMKNYFQNRIFAYANYFEAKVGEDGRLVSFMCYEKSLNYQEEVGGVSISKFDASSFAPYLRWKEAGEKEDVRIYDLKSSYKGKFFDKLCYQDETVEISATVAGFDMDGAFYVSNQNDKVGNVAIRVELASNVEAPSLSDIITVKGTIEGKNGVAYISDATYTKTGEADFYPIFDEEAIADYYGGGYYAAYAFSGSTIYADSIYSTYAYVASLPTALEEGKQAKATLVCPTFSDDNGNFFTIGLILPSSMGVKDKEKIIDDLKGYGIYSKKNNEAEQVCFSDFIVRYDTTATYGVSIEYSKNSSIGLALSPKEKVEKELGIANFPIPSASTFFCYRFGGSSGQFLESTYGRDEKSQTGIYYYASISSSELDKFVEGLKSIGFSLHDVIKDAYSRAHDIYKKDDYIVDFYATKGVYDENYTINMWIYQGDLIYMATIQEILAEKVPYFDSDDFIMPEGVYQADCAYYALPSAAGQRFSSGAYIPCLTLDLDSDLSADIRKRYREEKGYATYRDENDKPYTYTTRGEKHTVLYKDIEGSDEKLFLDTVTYPTDDYTFTGHSKFSYRMEIMIYKGKAPLSTVYEDSLDSYFTEAYERSKATSCPLPSFSLPSDAKMEIVYACPTDTMEQFEYTYYGYFGYLNAFVYSSDVDALYDDIIEGLTSAGYELYTTSEKGNPTYVLSLKGNSNGVSFGLIKDSKRKFVRIIEGYLGLDF